VDDISRMRALGFCVSVEHARFMARVFQASGVAATAIWSDTPESERRQALLDLAARRINIIFSVDLFNEGVDVPAVDTLLMLRPTDSATLFLQQLGRGLRRSVGKTVCTVLDFVGHHRKEFRFDRRLRALLGGTRRELEVQIASGFPFLPAGCHMELDRVASQIVLDNVRHAVPSRRAERVEALRSLASGATSVTLPAFLAETGLELEEVYVNNVSWSDLCQEAGLTVQPPGPDERLLRRACGRLLHVDDRERIESYREFLENAGALNVETLTTRQRRLLRMLVGSVVGSAVSSETTLMEGAALLLRHPQVQHELRELLGVLAERNSTMCRYRLRPTQRSPSVFTLAIRESKSWQPLALVLRLRSPLGSQVLIGPTTPRLIFSHLRSIRHRAVFRRRRVTRTTPSVGILSIGRVNR